MKLSKFAVPAILAATAFLPLVGAPTVAQGAAVTRTATKVAQPLLSQVKLNLGEVTVYDYGTLKLHAYKSNDVLSDECYVVEGKDGLVLLESSAFKDNVRELNQYIKSLKKPLEGMFLSYHPNGYTVYANAPIYATNEALASWNDNGGVAALTTNFVKAFGDAVDTNLPAKATPVKVGETVTVAGVDFKILATPDEDYSVEIPAIHAIYRHMLGSKVHSILPNLDYMDRNLSDSCLQ